jgi:hypothetical protein
VIDLIPGIKFTDTEKQVYGSIARALLGAIIGSAFSFAISRHERKKQVEIGKVEHNRAVIRKNANALQQAEMTLADILIKCDSNSEYTHDLKQSIVRPTHQGTVALIQAATPFEYPTPSSDLAQNLLNDKFVNLWIDLCHEVDRQNKNLGNFAHFYQGIFETIHVSMLKRENIDASVLTTDNNTIAQSMEQQVQANQQLRNKCRVLIAYIDCFKAYLQETDVRKLVTPTQQFNYITEIQNYIPSEAQLENCLQDNIK